MMIKKAKKTASLILAMIVIVSMSLIATAAPSVTSVETGVFIATLGYSNDAYQPGAVLGDISKDFGPGATINIFLNPAKFSGSDLNFTPANGMSKRTLESAGIQLRTSSGKNSNLIQSVSLIEQTLNGKPVAYIQVKLVSNFTETSSRDFETTISLFANKKKTQSLVVGGTLSNSTQEVATGDDYVYLGDGSVVTAADNIQSIEIDTGNNISIFSRMFKDRQYYAVSSLNPSATDTELMTKYPEIQMIVRLDTRGFDASNPEVSMKLGETFFAYNADGKYLGKTNQRVAFSSKYFLSTVEISFTPDVDPTDNTSSEPADAGTPPGEEGTVPSTDNDPPAPVQVGGGDSDIPDTGIPMGLKVAIGAGVASVGALVVIGLTSKKKED